MIDERALYRAILRTDLVSFVKKVFIELDPSSYYQEAWHIELIADHLSAITKQEGHKKLIINVPPRSLKSLCISVAWPAWLLGLDSTKRIIAASFASNLSIKHSIDCKSIIQSPWYRELFFGTVLSSTARAKYQTTNHGFRMATSVGAMVTGEGADLLIIDDPHNPSHMHSKQRRKNVIDWYEGVFASRLNNKKSGAIVLVMQRLHEDDLTGYLLKTSPGSWHHLKIPAIAHQKNFYQVRDKVYIQEEGEIFHPARFSHEVLVGIEKEIGMSNFAAQYMQEPIRNSISILKLESINFYQKADVEYTVQSWDTAIKTSIKNDYSVCSTWGIKKGAYYLLDVYRAKLTYPELKNEAIALYNKHKPVFIIIEDHGSGQSLLQDLKLEQIHNLIGIKHKLDKVTRFASVVPLFEAGLVLLPEAASWLRIVIDELTNFPGAKHDDIVDSVSQFLCYMKNKGGRTINIRVI